MFVPTPPLFLNVIEGRDGGWGGSVGDIIITDPGFESMMAGTGKLFVNRARSESAGGQ